MRTAPNGARTRNIGFLYCGSTTMSRHYAVLFLFFPSVPDVNRTAEKSVFSDMVDGLTLYFPSIGGNSSATAAIPAGWDRARGDRRH